MDNKRQYILFWQVVKLMPFVVGMMLLACRDFGKREEAKELVARFGPWIHLMSLMPNKVRCCSLCEHTP